MPDKECPSCGHPNQEFAHFTCRRCGSVLYKPKELIGMLREAKEDLRKADEEIGWFTEALSKTACDWDDKCDELERLWKILDHLFIPALRRGESVFLEVSPGAVEKRDIARIERMVGIKDES